MLQMDKGGTQTNGPKDKEIDADTQAFILIDDIDILHMLRKMEEKDSQVLRIAQMPRYKDSRNTS